MNFDQIRRFSADIRIWTLRTIARRMKDSRDRDFVLEAELHRGQRRVLRCGVALSLAVSLPLMKYTNILTFDTRVGVLFLSLFINMPWLFFIFEIFTSHNE